MDPNQNSNPQPLETPPQAEAPQQPTVTAPLPPQPTPPVEPLQTPPVQPQPATPARNRGLEMVIPINRSGWSIAAGYVALFNIPFVVMAPIGLVLGLVGLNDIKKNPSRAGRGRCWFAVIYSTLTIVLVAAAFYFNAQS